MLKIFKYFVDWLQLIQILSISFETVRMANNYKIDLEDLKLEFRQVKTVIKKHNVSLKNVKELDAFIRPLWIAFPELCKILKISLTLPITTAECERSFRKQKWMKIRIRTPMLDQTLKRLAIISIHRMCSMNIEINDVVDRFVKRFLNIMLDLVGSKIS